MRSGCSRAGLADDLRHRRFFPSSRYGTPLNGIKLETIPLRGGHRPVRSAVLHRIHLGKRSLTLVDAVVLIAIYIAYLVVLSKMPPEDEEGMEDLELIPRTIVTVVAAVRNTAILALFLVAVH